MRLNLALGLLVELVDNDPADNRADDRRAQIRPASARLVVALRMGAAGRLGPACAVAVAAAVNPAAVDAPPLLVIAVSGSDLHQIVKA
jgi:hypothetical protein